jgi:hypothetical protein
MSESQANNGKKQTVRANDFRYIPADYFNAALSEDGVKLVVGVEEVSGEATELVAMQLTLKSAYGLMMLLTDAMKHAEEEFGFKFEEANIIGVD